MDLKARLEAILAQAQISKKKEKKSRVRSHLTMDASGSRTVQITTSIMREGISCNISILDMGPTTREQKIDHLQGSITTIFHQMNKDKTSKEELKAQVENLIGCIQEWSSTKELPTTSSATPLLLSKDHINKLEKRKNWTKATEDWFQRVIYNGHIGINCAIRIAYKFLEI